MAAVLTTTIATNVSSVLSEAQDLSNRQSSVKKQETLTLTNGVIANKADLKFDDTRTLAGSANEELDLTASLIDGFGEALTFVKLKYLYIKNKSTTDNLIVGGAAANALALFSDPTDKLPILPGGVFTITSPDLAGLAVGANDKLKLEHSGATTTSLDYDIIILGTSS